MAKAGRARWRKPQRRDRGATLVEYAVVLSLIVVVSIPAIDRLTDRSTDEVANQAECITTRPPPPGCQLQAIPPPPEPDAGEDPGDPGDDPVTDPDECDTDDTDECDEPESSASWGPLPTPVQNAEGYWEISATVMIVDDEGAPVSGAVVSVRFTESPTNAQAFPQCTSLPDGSCTVTFTTSVSDPTNVAVRVLSVVSEPPIGEATTLVHNFPFVLVGS